MGLTFKEIQEGVKEDGIIRILIKYTKNILVTANHVEQQLKLTVFQLQ